MGAGIVGTLGLIYLGFTVLFVAACVSIVRKAGYSGWWVAAGAVPLVNVVMLFAFAFADWPALRDLRRAQSAPLAAGHPSFGNATNATNAAIAAAPVQTASGHPGFVVPAQPEPVYAAQPVYAPAAEPAHTPPAYTPPPGYPPVEQPAPSAPPPRFPGYQQPNILPER